MRQAITDLSVATLIVRLTSSRCRRHRSIAWHASNHLSSSLIIRLCKLHRLKKTLIFRSTYNRAMRGPTSLKATKALSSTLAWYARAILPLVASAVSTLAEEISINTTGITLHKIPSWIATWSIWINWCLNLMTKMERLKESKDFLNGRYESTPKASAMTRMWNRSLRMY